MRLLDREVEFWYYSSEMAEIFNIPVGMRLALHSLLLLRTEQQRRWTVAQLAARLAVSAAHLAKVLVRLENVGLVEGRTGPAGGYCLARAPEKINLLSVYEALEGRLRVNGCPFAVPICAGNGCSLGGFLQGVNRQVVQRLKETTLADLKINIGGKK